VSDTTSRAREGNGRTYSDAEIAAAIVKAKGNLSAAARDLGCWRSTIYDRMESEPSVRAVYADAVEETIDAIEQNLVDEALNRANPEWLKAADRWLRARGRHRGFGDRIELAGDKDAPLNITFIPAGDT